MLGRMNLETDSSFGMATTPPEIMNAINPGACC